MDSKPIYSNLDKLPQSAVDFVEEWSESLEDSSLASDYSYISHNHEWNSSITEDGNLFYVKFTPQIIQKSSNQDDNTFFRNEYKRMSMRRNDNILSRFSTASKQKKSLFDTKIIEHNVSELADCILKEYTVSITPKLKEIQKSTTNDPLSEQMFGFSTSLFTDGNKIVVNKILDNSLFSKKNALKTCDWIKSIDEVPVDVDNFELILSSIKQVTKLKLVFQENLELESKSAVEIKISNLNELIENSDMIFPTASVTDATRKEIIFSLIYISKDELDNNENLDQSEVKYCYPSFDQNIFFQSRGSYVTLESLIKSAFSTKTNMTTICAGDTKYHVTYSSVQNGEGLLLFGFNSTYIDIFNLRMLSASIMHFLEIKYASVYNVFIEYTQIDELNKMCEIIRNGIMSNKSHCTFEKSFFESHFVALPKEIQLRVDDALSELEAMDYRNWNDDLLDLFDDFSIIGCCLYYGSHLVTTHLNSSYLHDIKTFLTIFGISEILENTNVKDMIIWHRFYPVQNRRNSNLQYCILLVAKSSLVLATVLEITASPSITTLSYYVEEIRDILEYFRSTGIENLIRIWINSNKRPKCLTTANVGNHNTPEMSIQKNMIISETSSSLSVKSQTIREESGDDDENSDWEGEECVGSQRSSSGFDMTDISESIYKEFNDIIPSMLTFGPKNLLYHFVQLEIGEGILLAPVTQGNSDSIIETFSKTCVLIHGILQNTVKFRQILSKETTKLNSHRSLVAIKEQGLLMTIKNEEGKDECEKFWVVGRLFTTPSRELYVCHKTDAPQNLVELAFRICLSCAG